MGPRADRQVVAKTPVIEVVNAALAGLGPGGNLVALVARIAQPAAALRFQSGEHGVLGQPRPLAVKARVGFDGELVPGHMGRPGGQGLLHIGQALRQRLPRQPVHQVEVVTAHSGRVGGRDRGLRAAPLVKAPEALEGGIVKALDTQREAGDSGLRVAGEALPFHAAGIGFQGNFGVGSQRRASADALQQARDSRDAEQARRAPADKHRDQLAGAAVRLQLRVEVAQQGADVGVLRDRRPLVRIEVAVGAFFLAPRQVHVQAERDRRRRGRGAPHAPTRSSRRRRAACARWLRAFFTGAASSAALALWLGTKNSES